MTVPMLKRRLFSSCTSSGNVQASRLACRCMSGRRFAGDTGSCCGTLCPMGVAAAFESKAIICMICRASITGSFPRTAERANGTVIDGFSRASTRSIAAASASTSEDCRGESSSCAMSYMLVSRRVSCTRERKWRIVRNGTHVTASSERSGCARASASIERYTTPPTRKLDVLYSLDIERRSGSSVCENTSSRARRS